MEQGNQSGLNSSGSSNGGLVRFIKRNKLALSVATAAVMAGVGYKFVYLNLGEKQQGESKTTQSPPMDLHPFTKDEPDTSASELKSQSSTKSVEEPKKSHQDNGKGK